MNSRSAATSIAIVVAMISPIALAQTTETEVNRFQPSLAGGGDRLGSSVSVDGSLIVVGAPTSDVYGNDAGLAFIWEWRDTEWFLLDSIIPPAINPDDFFGASVAVSEEWVAVGAPFNDDMDPNAGAVHIFQVSEGAVSWKQTLYDANPNADNQFGYSVAMDGSTLVAGAPQTDSVNVNEGSATVFKLSGSTWIQDVYLPSPEGSANEYTGFSVDVSESCTLGTTVLLGAPETYNIGFVHVYYYDGLNWLATGSWESPNPGTDYMFGYSVAIDGDLVAVGEPTSDELSTNAGAAHVFEYSIGIGFIERANLEPALIADNDLMGSSVSVSGTDVLVGVSNGEGGGPDTGRADLWEVNFSGAYVHSKIYEASDLTGTDVGSLGHSVALSGREAVVGSPQVDSATGAAYIFSNQRYWLTASGGNWIDGFNWTGGRIPDYESAIFFGLNDTLSVDIGNNNAEGDSLHCFAGSVTILDSSGGGLGSLNIYGETGDWYGGLSIASYDSGYAASLTLQGCTSNVSGTTHVGGAASGEGVFSIVSSSGQYVDILIGTGGDGEMGLSSSSTLNVEGVIQLGTTASSTGSLRVEGSSSITIVSADGSSIDMDVQDGTLQIESGSSISCDIGAHIHRDGLVTGDGLISAPTIVNEGRIISDASAGVGLQLDGYYYQTNEDDFGNILNGLMVVKGLTPGIMGIEVADTANLGGGCVVDVTDPDTLNVADVLDVVTASLIGNEFAIWFVPAVSDDKFLDTSMSLRGPGSGVSLIVQPLGTTFGFHPATAGEGASGAAEAMVVDDFNGDLVDDLAIAVGGASGFIDIWLNDGAGTLCLDSRIPLSDVPSDLTAADFDQDMDLDFGVVIPALDTALVYLNDGSGNFSLGATLVTGDQPEGITAFSLNGDTLPDIAVTNYLDDTLTTYENTTTLMPLGFAAGSTVATVSKPKPVSPGGIGTGTDKDDDLIVAGDEEVGGHNNDGLISGISAVEVLDPLGTPVDLAVLDLNGDGFDDIAVTLDGTDSLSVFMNDTASGFDSAALNNAGAAGGTLLSSDMDDDGDDDIVLIEIDSTTSEESIVALRNDSTSLSLGVGGGYSPAMLARAGLGGTGRGLGSDTGLLGAGDIDVDAVTDVIQVVTVLGDYQILVQTAASGSPWAPDACCPGDIDGSGDVGVDDLLAIIGAWGVCADPGDCPEDLNGNGTVDVDDLLALLSAFGGC